MLALIDSDLIAYEASTAAECVDEGFQRRSFDYVIEYIDNLIAFITKQAGCDSHELFITGKGNFRFDIATLKPYKGNRKEEEKPFHLEASRKYLESLGANVAQGYEADDAIAIRAKQLPERSFVICSRDKDLRMIEGFQYGWEVGLQPEFEVVYVDELGTLEWSLVNKVLKNGEPSKAIKKIWGTGYKWFCCQLITGDSTDNISGLEGKGAGLAVKILPDCTSKQELLGAVVGAYRDKYGETYAERLLEQGRLLWMHDTLDEEGDVILWEIPNEL